MCSSSQNPFGLRCSSFFLSFFFLFFCSSSHNIFGLRYTSWPGKDVLDLLKKKKKSRNKLFKIQDTNMNEFQAFEIFMGSGLCFGRVTGVKGKWEKRKWWGMDSAVRLNRKVWPIYKYRSHKKVEKLSDKKLSEVCQTDGYRKLRYFKWWVMNDEWWVMSGENWVRSDEWWKKKKIQTAPWFP